MKKLIFFIAMMGLVVLGASHKLRAENAAIGLNITHGPITIENGFVRQSMGAAGNAAAYMKITSTKPTRLLRASSPQADLVELHNTAHAKSDHDIMVMKMHTVDAIDIPQGQSIYLKAGGLHVMVQKLHKPLMAGDQLTLFLEFEGQDMIKLTLPVIGIHDIPQ